MTKHYCDFCGQPMSYRGNFIPIGGYTFTGITLFHSNNRRKPQEKHSEVDICDECEVKIKDFVNALITDKNSVLSRRNLEELLGIDVDKVKEGESK